MEIKFNFNSAICTTREQSERLLALGLKKETADCYWFYCDIVKEWKCTILSSTQVFEDYPTKVIPAWSLHRLVSTLINNGIIITFIDNIVIIERYKAFQKSYEFWDDVYDNIIDCIEWLIGDNRFNKEYLEE